MIECYCLCKLTETQITSLNEEFTTNAASKKLFTPAQVEGFCAEMDDADAALKLSHFMMTATSNNVLNN